MAEINWDSIMSKAMGYMETPEMKTKVREFTDSILLGKIRVSGKGAMKAPKTVEDAAAKFIEVLYNELNSHIGADYVNGEFSALARDALSDLDYGKPYRVGDEYYIGVYFNTDLHRKSLEPTKYGGIDNIAALLNSGYLARNYVYGVWTDHMGDRSTDVHGRTKKIPSLRERAGTHFVEQAIADFMGNYATEYNVLSITPSEDYEIRTD